jgi:hypothetical protein
LFDQKVKLVLTNDGCPMWVDRHQDDHLKIAVCWKQAQGEQDRPCTSTLTTEKARNDWVTVCGFISIRPVTIRWRYPRANSPENVVDLLPIRSTKSGYQASRRQATVESINSFFVVLQIVYGGIGAISLLAGGSPPPPPPLPPPSPPPMN